MRLLLLMRKLLFLLMLGLLTACGGGSDEPSNFFDDTGGNVGGTAPQVEEDTEDGDIAVRLGGQQIIPSGGSTTIVLKTFKADDDVSTGEIYPNATFDISLFPKETAAQFVGNVPTSSDANGDAKFTVSHPGSGNVTIDVSGRDRVERGFSISLYFGATAISEVIQQGESPVADGVTPVLVSNIVRDYEGSGIPGIPVGFSFPLDSFATVVYPETGNATDFNGELIVGIVDTVPQTTKVTPFVGGMATAPLTLTFLPSQQFTTPNRIDLILKSNNVPADGVATVTLLVIARDDDGSPIANIPLNISSDSATAFLNIGGETAFRFLNGSTSASGTLTLNITNTVAEEVNISATTTSGEQTTENSIPIVFVEVEEDTEDPVTGDGTKVNSIVLDPLINDGALANGVDTVTMVGQVLDENEIPVADLPVSILLSGGSAELEMANGGNTNEGGFFIAVFTDTVPETFSARAVVGKVSSELQEISFVAVPPPEPGEEPETFPQTITILANPETQVIEADSSGNISLTVVVRDNQNTPMSGIPVTMSANVNTVEFDNRISETGSGGTASFTLTHNQPGDVTLTASIEGPAGPITAEKLVRFVTTGDDVTVPDDAPVEVTDLEPKVINSPQLANGQNAIQLDVIAKDKNGNPLSGVPLSVQMSAGIAAKANPASGTTGVGGFFSTQITSTQAGDINVIIAVEGGIVSSPQTITFTAALSEPEPNVQPATIDFEIVNNGQPADGQSKITLVVRPRDENGTPMANLNVELVPESFNAVIAETTGITNSLGEFRTTVTNEVAETVAITPVVNGMAGPTNNITFIDVTLQPAMIDFEILNNGQPADGTSQITLVVRPRDNNGIPIPDMDIELISDSFNAVISQTTGKTNVLGEFRTTVTNTIAESFNITPVARGSTEVITGVPQTVTFISVQQPISPPTDLTVTVVESTNNQPPTGQTENAVTIQVIARNAQGVAVANVPVSVRIVGGTAAAAAIAIPSQGVTDDNGLFTTQITSTTEGTVDVSLAVEGSNVVSSPQTVTFVTPDLDVDVLIQPATIDFEILNNGQPADGTSQITLVLRPRDNTGAVIPNLDVELISESFNAVIAQTTGQTNVLGEFRTTVTSTVVESFNVTPVARGTTDIITGTPQILTFVQIGTETPPQPIPTDLTVTIVETTNNQPATGKLENAVSIQVIARDEQGRSMGEVPISVRIPTGTAAVANPAQGTTDANGLFTTQITSTVSGSVEVRMAIEGTEVVKEPVLVTFVAISPGAPGSTLESVELRVENSPQNVGSESAITLIAIPRGIQGAPVADINIELISNSDNAQIAASTGKTNVLGEYRTTVTSAIVGDYQITPVAWKDGEENAKLVGTAATVQFTSIGAGVTDLTVTMVNNSQPANGTAAIQLDMVARDSSGSPVAGAPISVQLPSGSAVVANPSFGATDPNGFFSTQLTSRAAGEVPVTIAVEGAPIAPNTQVVTFIAAIAVTPATVELQVLNAPQPADGEAVITLVAIPRDVSGTPITGVEVQLVPDSTTIARAAQIAETQGTTNPLGEFSTTVTNNIAGTFNITPITGNIEGNPTPIEFTPIGIGIGSLEVTVVNDNQPADGQAPIRIDVVARDAGGIAMARVPIAVIIDSGAAVATPSRGETIENGSFTTNITSTVSEQVAVTIAVEGTSITAPPKLINFVVPGGGDITPASVELRIENAPQPADGASAITLVVTPRDARGNPMGGVDVELISDSDQINIASATGTTNAVGEFRTTVVTAVDMTETLTEALVVNVTPVVAGGLVQGQPVPIIFRPVAVAIPATLTLNVSNNNPIVNEEVLITVLAQDEVRDENGNVVGNVPLAGVKARLLVEPLDGIIFGANGFEGNTGGNGTFQTSITRGQTGLVKVTAEALGRGGEPILNSNAVDINFIIADPETLPEVSSVELITSSPQLPSEGAPEGVTITAIVKNQANNLVENALVSFSASSGNIQVTRNTTDATGTAEAILTTQGNPDNRTITINASVTTATGEAVTDTLTIDVVGTQISITGQDSLSLGSTADLNITLQDSAENGIGGQTLTVVSSLGNTLSNPAPVTNANGEALITLTAVVPGQDTITISKDGAVSASFSVTISADNFTLTPFPVSDVEEIEVPLNTPQELVAHWDKQGIPQTFQQISLSATRGQLPESVATDINGDARFSISSTNAGPAVVKAATADGSQQDTIRVNFVATQVSVMTLQANPSTIGANVGLSDDAEKEQSEILAILQDPEGNLVEGQRVNFNLVDTTGGNLSTLSVRTNALGEARTVYTSSSTPSGFEGITVIATVDGQPNLSCAGSQARDNGCAVQLTVALKEAFVSIGTGNKIFIVDEVTYGYPFKALVTDIGGAPIPNTDVILSIVSLSYFKGFYQFVETGGDGEGEETTGIWEPTTIISCPSEDVNRNGLLDQGEDINSNAQLDPGGRVTFTGGTENPTGNTVTVRTGTDGFADFTILYFKEYANWLMVELTARTQVAGSEGIDTASFMLTPAAEDLDDQAEPPPGRTSPFGSGIVMVEDENGNLVPDFSQATCSNEL
jgi:adhesin/invasin